MRKTNGLLKGILLPVYATTLFAMSIASASSTPVSAASCSSEPVTTTGRAETAVAVTTPTTYTVWSKLRTAATTPVSYVFYANGECLTIGGAALTPNTYT